MTKSFLLVVDKFQTVFIAKVRKQLKAFLIKNVSLGLLVSKNSLLRTIERDTYHTHQIYNLYLKI